MQHPIFTLQALTSNENIRKNKIISNCSSENHFQMSILFHFPYYLWTDYYLSILSVLVRDVIVSHTSPLFTVNHPF